MTYSAFISYSHEADAELATTLRSALQRFAKPWYRLRAVRVFHDGSSLTPDPSLWDAVREALDTSEHLILLASPRAARSDWVNREIEHWLAAHSLDSILLVLSGGDVRWDPVRGRFDPDRTTCLPAALMAAYRSEPLYLDLRWVGQSGGRPSRRDPRLRDVVASLSAVLRGQPRDELIGEDVRAHRRALRLAWTAGAVTFVLALAASVAAVVANTQRREAQRQRDTARARLLGVQAEQLLDQNPELLTRSVLLAVEAMRAGAGPEAGHVLRSAVALLPRLGTEIDVGPLERATTLSFDPSGDLVAVGGPRGLGLWNADDGTRLQLTDGPGSEALEFDPDGASLRIVRSSTVERISVPDLARTDTLWRQGFSRGRLGGGSPGWFAWPTREGTVEAASLVRNGTRVTLRLDEADAATGRPPPVAFDADGRLLAAIDDERRIHLWDLPSGHRRRVFPAPTERGFAIPLLALSPGGDRLAAVRDGDSVEIWRLDTDASPLSIDHGGTVEHVLFAPDGGRLVTAGGGVVRIWDVGGSETRRIPYEETVDAVAFSPDGTRVAIGHRDARVRVWDLTATRAGMLTVPVGKVNAVALSPDARYLATGEDAGVARVWDVATGRVIRHLEHPPSTYANHVSGLSFTADESELVTTRGDGTTTVWTLADGVEVARLPTPDLGFSSRLGPRGTLIAGLTPGVDRTEVWDIRTGRRVASIAHGGSSWRPVISPDLRLVAIKRKSQLLVHALPSGEPVALVEIDPELTINDFAFSPDARYVAVGGEDRTVTVHDLRRDTAVAELAHESDVTDVEFDGEGDHLLSHPVEGPVRVFATDTWEEVVRLSGAAPLVALTSGNSRVVTADEGRTVRVWEIPSGRLVRELRHTDEIQLVSLPGDRDLVGIGGRRSVAAVALENGSTLFERRFLAQVTGFAMSESGDRLAVGLSDGGIQAWEVGTGHSILSVRGAGAPEDVGRVLFGADGRRLVTVAEDAHVWDLSDGSEIARMGSQAIAGAAVALTADGERLAVGGSSATLTVWDVATLERVMTAEHDHSISAVAFSPDGRQVATAGPQGSLARVWRVADGELARTITVDPGGGLLGVAFHPDGERVLTAGRDGSVRFWSLDDGTEVGRFLQGTAVLGLDVTPDGRFMATTSADHSARVWDLETGRLIGLVPHDMGTHSLALSRDGTLLATVTLEGALSLWLLDSERLLTEACQRLSRNLTWDEWRQYGGDRPYRKTCPALPLHGSFVQAAFEMAQAGDPEAARAQLLRARELEPTLAPDVEPEIERMAAELERQGSALAEQEEIGRAAQRFEAATELLRQDHYDYERRARVLAARAVLDAGIEHAFEGEVEEAWARFDHAATAYPDVEIAAGDWDGLCWSGIIHGHAGEVLEACHRAVERAGADLRGFFADARGVGRVAVGDTAGAIADFETSVRWAAEREPMADLADLRQEWIAALRHGADPLEGSSILAHGNEMAAFRMELGLSWQLNTIR